MAHFTQPYLRSQLHALIRHTRPQGAARVSLLARDAPLFILSVDVKNSTAVPLGLRDGILKHLNLYFATEVAGRGGWVTAMTDGVDAFFENPLSAVKTAMAIYHRKRQVQEQIVKPIVAGHYARKPNLEPRLDHRDLDYRVVVLEFPPDQKNQVQKDYGDDAALTELSNLWQEAATRYGNKQSFLISPSVLKCATEREPLLERIFDATPVPVIWQKDPSERIQAFFGRSLLNYSNPDFPYFVYDEESDTQTYGSGDRLEAEYRAAFHKRKDRHAAWSAAYASSDSDIHSFEPFRIEKWSGPRSLPGAVVLGDVNLDLVTYLKDAGIFAGNQGKHVQLQQDIEKIVAGKGMNIARALEDSRKFGPIMLIAKLGMDREMAYIVQDLKSHVEIRPLLMLSNTLPTGTSILLRRHGHNASILTITDKPNANSDLRVDEIRPYLADLLENDYVFISGYCLTDNRIELVSWLLDELKKHLGKRAILEFSPANLLWGYFSESRERKRRLKEVVELCFLVAYEEGAFGNEEDEILRGVPYALKVTSEFDKALQRQRGKWTKIRDIPVMPERSLGLFSQVVAEYLGRSFLKPRLLLCSLSPRRYELLSSLYGHSAVYHHLRSISPEFRMDRFDSAPGLAAELVRVTCQKMIGGLTELTREVPAADFDFCDVAIASDLVVVAEDGDKIRVLDKPDESENPIQRVHDLFSRFYSGKSHFVLTCTCFVDFRGLVTRNDEWHAVRFAAINEGLEDYINGITNGSVSEIQEITDISANGGMIREWTVEIASENGWSASAVFLVASSRVTFRDLSESEIAEYIASGEWRNKGGGYAVQGNAAYLIAAVGGMFTNVVGLPMSELSRILASRFNIHPVESLVQQRNRPRAANV